MTRQQAQFRARRSARDPLYQQSGCLRQIENLGERLAERENTDAAPWRAALDQQVLCRVRGDRKANALESPRLTQDVAHDANHIAIHIEHRTTRIAAVDADIGLEKFCEIERPAQRAR